MANVKKGNQTAFWEMWKHLRYFKRSFWKQERQAQERALASEADLYWEHRGQRPVDCRATVDENGDTVWPDSVIEAMDKKLEW